jgi:hypothetical protein
MDLIERLMAALDTDEEDREKSIERAAWNYEKATPDQQRAIDRIFICLCGWSLRTLLSGAEEDPAPAYNPFVDARGEPI